jgi:hypothetical protein
MQIVDVMVAHTYSSRHRQAIEESKQCGCFYCGHVFEPAAILEWCDEGATALCPHCGIDAVLGDASPVPAADPAFLTRMHGHWFASQDA